MKLETTESESTPTTPEAQQVGQHCLVLRNGIRPAIKFLRDYLNTYEEQGGIDDYTVETWVNDIIYGLGMSLDPEAHKWAKGHREFEGKLREFLSQNSVVIPCGMGIKPYLCAK